jgi:hypothetical protein
VVSTGQRVVLAAVAAVGVASGGLTALDWVVGVEPARIGVIGGIVPAAVLTGGDGRTVAETGAFRSAIQCGMDRATLRS